MLKHDARSQFSFNAVREKEKQIRISKIGAVSTPTLSNIFLPNWRDLVGSKMDTSRNSKNSHGTLELEYEKRLGNHRSDNFIILLRLDYMLKRIFF